MSKTKSLIVRNRLRQLLIKKKISGYRLHIDTGLTKTTIYDLSNNPHRLPSSSTLSILMIYFGVSASEIIELVEE